MTQSFLQALACNLIKKETLAQLFSCGFCENFKNSFFIEHLWPLLLKGKRCTDCFLWKIEISETGVVFLPKENIFSHKIDTYIQPALTVYFYMPFFRFGLLFRFACIIYYTLAVYVLQYKEEP